MALEGLESLIKGLENQSSWQAQKQFRLVVQHWPKSVGFAVARQTRPVAIQRSTLYVATATAAWAQTLAYERLNILRKLNRHQRQPIKNIRFSAAQWKQPVLPAPSPSAQQHPSYVKMSAVETSAAIALSEGPEGPKGPKEREPRTPNEAFSRWADTVQKMQRAQSLCPQCQCYCPQGELDRWSICSLCATKRWR